ncbi:thiosulfate dehydrogenase [quinone] large subunit [Paenibacillus sp. 453mf]|nr:thiosulfate dehydrogenase [quinone] large subunit [Paenibacillus sp. 453mf]
MFTTWLRENKVAMWLLTVLRVYLGYDWMTHGWQKLTGGGFDATGFLTGAIEKSTGENAVVQGWWGAFFLYPFIPKCFHGILSSQPTSRGI